MGKQEQSKDAETCWNKRTWHCQKRCQTKSWTIPNYHHHHILSVVWVACAKLSVTETKSKATLGIALPVQCCTSTTAKHGRNRIAVSLRPRHALPTWSTFNNQTKTPRVIQHWGVHIGAYIDDSNFPQGACWKPAQEIAEIAILYNESLGFIAVSHCKWQHGHCAIMGTSCLGFVGLSRLQVRHGACWDSHTHWGEEAQPPFWDSYKHSIGDHYFNKI